MGVKGQIVGGEFGKLVLRQKSDQAMEVGELMVADTKDAKILLQVFDLCYGSQISQQNLELIAGMKLEQDSDINFMDAELRNYTLAFLKPLITIENSKAKSSKIMPRFFSEVREVSKDDLSFFTKPKNPLFFGKLRSGSNVLDVDICLDAEKVFSHHILIPGTTGRGKSVLMSNILWDTVDKDYCAMLVLDPHDEYYGRNKLGLKDHSRKEMVSYYTPENPPSGCRTLKINICNLVPWHFNGVVDFSDAQKQAINAYYKKYDDTWVEAVLLEKPLDVDFMEGTIAVVKRRLLQLLDLEANADGITCNGIFDLSAGMTTIKDIVNELENSKTVIIDTSSFSGDVELLVGSLVATEILNRYKHHKTTGTLNEKPVISIVLEEAPRVLGKDVLEKGSNIFATIAREGRKFRVGLTAITQLPSLIPREILANMNTKIILGTEMAPERQAIIESASQDLSTDNRAIASLDIGEAIISSNFARFATPIKIPSFDDTAKSQKKEFVKKNFSGVGFAH